MPARDTGPVLLGIDICTSAITGVQRHVVTELQAMEA
jgi:hypothetical protein